MGRVIRITHAGMNILQLFSEKEEEIEWND
jgi:hypothetical protein